MNTRNRPQKLPTQMSPSLRALLVPVLLLPKEAAVAAAGPEHPVRHQHERLVPRCSVPRAIPVITTMTTARWHLAAARVRYHRQVCTTRSTTLVLRLPAALDPPSAARITTPITTAMTRNSSPLPRDSVPAPFHMPAPMPAE